jgi:hypothetical protein
VNTPLVPSTIEYGIKLHCYLYFTKQEWLHANFFNASPQDKKQNFRIALIHICDNRKNYFFRHIILFYFYKKFGLRPKNQIAIIFFFEGSVILI